MALSTSTNITETSTTPSVTFPTSIPFTSKSSSSSSITTTPTSVFTSVVTRTSSSKGTTVILTSVITPESSSTTSETPTGAALQPGADSGDDGGSDAKTIAVAVVVPVVCVALIAIAAVFLWRRHKSKKNAEELRRKEVEEYSYNPNSGASALGGVAGSEMQDETTSTGYRGWGSTTGTNRKMSTTLSSGFGGAFSENSSQPGGHHSPHSPGQGTNSDSVDPLMKNKRDTLDSAVTRPSDVHRGPSNASSNYSAANHSDDTGGNDPAAYAAYGGNPYEQASYQPVIQDVSARRNTRIESPSIPPPQGNAGIAQNF